MLNIQLDAIMSQLHHYTRTDDSWPKSAAKETLSDNLCLLDLSKKMNIAW